MSGFVGIVHLDGRPVSRPRLEQLTAALAFRGPDGQGTWADGGAGLGFAALATTDEARHERQPLSLDGEVWIVADARIDDRARLRAALAAHGRDARHSTDAELILHAYHAWGDEAPVHLLGDFSFAIWDRSRQRLLCARDHLGIKPLYYAEDRDRVLVSNTLGCLRRHPAVSAELDEQAIADYLLFEVKMQADATSFRDVRRLPAAHRRVWSRRRRTSRRYWAPPIDPDPPPARGSDWLEAFSAGLRTAVGDRLRGGRATVLMSGGLDSTAVAAVACDLTRARGENRTPRLLTFTFDACAEHREGEYAALAAGHLDTPLERMPVDGYALYRRRADVPPAPEPGLGVWDEVRYDLDRRIGGDSRVVLTGEGGDAILHPFGDYFLSQLRRLRLGTAARYLAGALWRRRRLPPLGLHTRWGNWRLRRRQRWRAGYPGWLAPDLERRLGLEERWRHFVVDDDGGERHPSHPEAHRTLTDIRPVDFFEKMDAGSAPTPTEHRHPLFDVRLAELVLATPPVPWCIDKHLLREAMRGQLPDAVRLRAKTPLPSGPLFQVGPGSALWRRQVERLPAMARFVDPQRVLELLRAQEVASDETSRYSHDVGRAVHLANWLDTSHRDGIAA